MTFLSKLKATIQRLNTIPCKCGCRETKVGREFRIDNLGPVCEYELKCAQCGHIVNYWAYGYFQAPNTWSEYILVSLHSVRFRHWRE